jgi:hypothetical protein
MTYVILFLGSGLLGVIGVVGGTLAGKYRTKSKQDFPTCSCHHELAFHDFKNNTCHFEVRRVHYKEKGPNQGERYGKEWAQCQCRKYTGPTPSAELFDSGMIWPSDTH